MGQQTILKISEQVSCHLSHKMIVAKWSFFNHHVKAVNFFAHSNQYDITINITLKKNQAFELLSLP